LKSPTLVGLALLAAAGIVAANALPASAATFTSTAIPVANGTGVVSTDTSTGLIYASSSVKRTSAVGTVYSLPAISVVNPTSKSVTKVIRLDDGSGTDQGDVVDIKVRAASHMVWVAVVGWQGGAVWQINGATNTVVRHVPTGYGTSVALERTADIAYVSDAAAYDNWDGTAEQVYKCLRKGPGRLYSINGSTGAVRSVNLPNPASFNVPAYACEAIKYPYRLSNRVAVDEANHTLQVVGTGYLWAYSSTLVLAHTLRLPSYSQLDSIGVTVNGSTNTVYTSQDTASGGSGYLEVINGATGTLTSKHIYTSGGFPVIDPSISTVYLHSRSVNTSTFATTGWLPYPAQAVNGSTHKVYAAAGTNVYIISRTG
jgi:hypothetical protein